MAKTIENFLSLYKDYEQLLRADGIDPKEREDSAEPVVGDRLRMCRQFRNYLSHVQDPGFLEPTTKMLDFLANEVNDLKSAGDIAKKHLKKPDTCMVQETDKVKTALEKCVKLKQPELVVIHKDGTYGIVSVYTLISMKGSEKVGVQKAKKGSILFCGPMDDYGDLLPGTFTLCTKDGEPDGPLLGQVWF